MGAYQDHGDDNRDRAKALDTDKRVRAAADSQIKTSAAGLGSRQNVTSRKPAPKQSDFGGDMKAFGAAMRSWRLEQDNDPEVQGQKKALKGL